MTVAPSFSRSLQQHQAGFTLAEILVAVFILGTLTLAIVSLATLGTRTAFESERQTVAQGLVNQHIERIRVLGYDSVGFTAPAAGEPDGVLLKNETRSQNNQNYEIATAVTLIDDPLNGTASPLTESSADYKKVEIKAQWLQANGSLRDIVVATYVARGALPILPSPSVSPSPSISPPAPAPGVIPPPCTCPDGTSCLADGTCCSNCLSTGCPAPSSGFTTAGYCYYTTWTCSLATICSSTGAGCSATTTYYPCYTPVPTVTPTLLITPTPTPSFTPSPVF